VIRLALAAALVALPALAPAAGPEVVDVTVGRADVARGFVAGSGRVVTVAHVLDAPGDVLVDGRPATVVRRDERLDLAVLAAPVDGPRARFGGTSRDVVRHANARVDGSPWRRPVLELRTEVEVGDSGTPVLSADGRVAGVVFARSNERRGRAWAVDGNAIVDLLPLRGTKSSIAPGSPASLPSRSSLEP
jgi:S1-C subfamily serine protease